VTPPSRYHPLLVALHWLLAVLIIGMLALGFFWLRAMPNTDPHKVDLLRLHMSIGILILVLMLARLMVRLSTARPPPVPTRSGRPDRLAAIGHYSAYAMVILIVASGVATALAAGLPAIVFGGSGAPLPDRFTRFPTFIAHTLLVELLTVFIVLHVLAALYRQIMRRDGLLGRMSFGRPNSGSLSCGD
jgi:cytochrome b561